MNKVILMGRLARDPEVRYTQAGKAVATFTLAVNRRGVRRNADSQQPTADFIPIVAWEKLAEFCGNYLVKGSQIIVEGRMQVRSYDAQDGSKRYVTEVFAENMEFAGPRPEGAGAPRSNADAGLMSHGGYQSAPMAADPAPGQSTGGFGNPLPADDDIPF